MSVIRPSRRRLLWLAPLLGAGLWTLLASSTFEEEPEPDPAQVLFALSGILAPISIDDGVIQSEAINLRIAGDYLAAAGDPLTIARDGLTVDTTSQLNLLLAAVATDDTLSADAALDVTFNVSVNFVDDPTTGQFSVLDDGTTSLVNVQSNPAGVSVEVGTDEARFLSWEQFRETIGNIDEDPAIRVAAIAWNQFPRTLRLARLGEEVAEEVEANKRMLEGMGLNEALELDCDREGGERVLFWRTDAPGSGEGSIGAGDSFEVVTDNCFDRRLDRYTKGTIVLADYLPTEDVNRTFGGALTFTGLFISEEEIDITTVPSETSPRISGDLRLRYDEVIATPEEN
jgi:hypothetical protein